MAELFVTTNVGPLVPQNVSFNDVNVFGQVNSIDNPLLGSARYNIDPSSRPGPIGYNILASDPNPSYIPLNTGAPMIVYDYETPNGKFELTDPFTITFLKEGNYNIAFEMICISQAPGQVVFQVLGSAFPFTVGGSPPICNGIGDFNVLSVLPIPGTPHATSLSCAGNMHATEGLFIRVAYLTNVDADVSLTSNISISET